MLKSFWHRRAANKCLNATVEEKHLNQPFTIKRVRVLLDGSLEIPEAFFTRLSKALGIAPVNVHIFVFSARSAIEKQYEHFFDIEEVTYFGNFQGELALMCAKGS